MTWVDVISTAVGVTSLVMSFFAIWLSWQFYREARGQSDRVSEAVAAIQITVSAVQTTIEKIVSRTVESLLDGQGLDSARTIRSNIEEDMNQIRSKLDSLENSKGQAPEEIIKMLDKVANDQERLSKEIETKMKIYKIGETAISDIVSVADPKVKISNIEIETCDENIEIGIVEINVLQPVKVATVTSSITSDIGQILSLGVELIECPAGITPPKVSSGIGRTSREREFNLHMNSAAGGTIEPGLYRIRYRANGRNAWWKRTFG